MCVGTWPPALGIFQTLLRRGKLDASLVLADGRKLEFERIYPLDAEYDMLDDVPAEVRENKRYKELGDFTHPGLRRATARRLRRAVPRRRRALAGERSRGLARICSRRAARGYLGAVSVSAYSMVVDGRSASDRSSARAARF